MHEPHGSRENIPEWRTHADPKRPRAFWTEFGEKKERESALPARLYRQIPIGDLYLLWRDHTLPMQHFLGSHQSGVEENSVGNFWFTEPVCLSSRMEGYVVTEPAKWQPGPTYVQESNMVFRSGKKWEAAGGGEWAGVSDTRSSIPEIHTGKLLSLDEITIFLGEFYRKCLAEGLAILENITAEQPFSHEMIPLVMNYKNIQERKSELVRERTLEECFMDLKDPAAKNEMRAFYAWALALPTVPARLIADIDDVAEDEAARNRNREAFNRFYLTVESKK